LLLAFEKI